MSLKFIGGCKPYSPEERFHFSYICDLASGCWLWRGTRSRGVKHQYGAITVNGKSMGAHQFSWILYNGPIPAGLHVCHTCDVPHCVNPRHLFVATAGDNNRDCAAKGRSWKGGGAYAPKGERQWNSKLTAAQVTAIRAETQKTQRALAAEYGVKTSCIWAIKHRKAWRHVP